jgi:hypothetical protein
MCLVTLALPVLAYEVRSAQVLAQLLGGGIH